jgi:hypothetical protein
MHRYVVLLAVCAAACAPDPETLRQKPAHRSVDVGQPYDTLANCLMGRFGQNYSVVPQLYPSEARAIFTLYSSGGSYMVPRVSVAEYRVTAISARASRIEARRHAGDWAPALNGAEHKTFTECGISS